MKNAVWFQRGNLNWHETQRIAAVYLHERLKSLAKVFVFCTTVPSAVVRSLSLFLSKDPHRPETDTHCLLLGQRLWISTKNNDNFTDWWIFCLSLDKIACLNFDVLQWQDAKKLMKHYKVVNEKLNKYMLCLFCPFHQIYTIYSVHVVAATNFPCCATATRKGRKFMTYLPFPLEHSNLDTHPPTPTHTHTHTE